MSQGFKAGVDKKAHLNKKTKNILELIEQHHSCYDPVLELINIYKNKKLL